MPLSPSSPASSSQQYTLPRSLIKTAMFSEDCLTNENYRMPSLNTFQGIVQKGNRKIAPATAAIAQLNKATTDLQECSSSSTLTISAPTLTLPDEPSCSGMQMLNTITLQLVKEIAKNEKEAEMQKVEEEEEEEEEENDGWGSDFSSNV